MWLFRRIAARIKAIAGSSGLLISPLPQWSLLFCECYLIKARTMSPCLRLPTHGVSVKWDKQGVWVLSGEVLGLQASSVAFCLRFPMTCAQRRL